MNNRKQTHLIIILVVVLAAVLPLVAAAQDGSGGSAGGFQAVSGADAAQVALPADLVLTDAQSLDAYGVRAERYQQKMGEALVLGGQVTVYRGASGQAEAVIGAHYPDLIAANQILLSADAAQAAVAAQVGDEGAWSVDLMIDPATARYFYRVETRRPESRWFYWLDAETGAVINAYDGIATGSGIGVLGDTKDLTGLTTFASGSYQLKTPDGRQSTYDAKNRSKLPGTLATDSNDIWNTSGRTSPGQRAMVDAHYYARVTDNYYLSLHSFNWKSYYSQGMRSTAHYSRNYVNAFWNGTQMTYGDGDGVNYLELSGDLDVVAHELSHGVTEATSDLIYQNQSGALNEAFSDIMGNTVEFYAGQGNWTMGEDIDVFSDGFRDMANPNADGDPSHWLDRYTGTSDNGGVHTNSGIANHWYYLLVNGGQNAKPSRASGTNVAAIGLAAAERIAFLGFTALPSNATFCNARSSTAAVAGSNAATVRDAWDEVGIDAALCGS
jgi:Zn-dependent metalloprotease